MDRLLAIAEAFNPQRECLDLDLDQIDLTWDEVGRFIDDTKMTHQGFAECFMGGLITRETVTKLLLNKSKMSRNHKFFLIYALKNRMSWVEKSGDKRKVKCETCGK